MGFPTKPALAITLIDRCVAAKVPAAWVADASWRGKPARVKAELKVTGREYQAGTDRYIPCQRARLEVGSGATGAGCATRATR